MKSYLINLDKDTERLAFFKANFDRLNIPFERVSAVDGRLFSEQAYQDFMKERPRDYNRPEGKQWLRGQMGCFLSHYSVWQKIAESKHNFAAVFEDDIHISDDLKYILEDDFWIPDHVDVIRLETSTNRVRLDARATLSYAGHPAYQVKSTSWCAGAYIMHRRLAQQLVALPAKYHEPADVMFYNFSESIVARELTILQFNPAFCTQDKHLANSSNQFASNIEFDPAPAPGHKFKKLSPALISQAIYKSLSGYKRISF